MAKWLENWEGNLQVMGSISVKVVFGGSSYVKNLKMLPEL